LKLNRQARCAWLKAGTHKKQYIAQDVRNVLAAFVLS
jgi:hypothetical protein